MLNIHTKTKAAALIFFRCYAAIIPKAKCIFILGIVMANVTTSFLYGQSLRKGATYIALKTVRENGNSVFIDGDFKKFTNLDYDIKAEVGVFYTNKAALGLSVSALMNHAWGNNSKTIYTANQQWTNRAHIRAEFTYRNYFILNPRLSIFLRSSAFYERANNYTHETQSDSNYGNSVTYRSNANLYGLSFRPALAYQLSPQWSVEAYSSYFNFSVGIQDSKDYKSRFLSFSTNAINNDVGRELLNLGVNYTPSNSQFRRYRKKISPISNDNTEWVIGGGFTVFAQNESFMNKDDQYQSYLLLTVNARNFIRSDVSLNLKGYINLDSQLSDQRTQNYQIGIGIEKYFPLTNKLYLGAEAELRYSTITTYQNYQTSILNPSIKGEVIYKFNHKWSLQSLIGNMDLCTLSRTKVDGTTQYYARLLGSPFLFSYFSLGLMYWIPGK